MILSKHKLSKANNNNVNELEEIENENVNIPIVDDAASSQSTQSQSSTESVSRSPLASILPDSTIHSKPASENETFPRFCRSKFDLTPTKPKPRSCAESAPLRTPDRYGGGIHRQRFGWSHRNMEETTFPYMTPRSYMNKGNSNSDYSETIPLQNTPRSVSKPCVSRRNASGRTCNGNGSTSWYRGPLLSRDCDQIEVPDFELKEDHLFWTEHNVQVLVRVRPLNTMEKNIYGFTRCLRQEGSQTITWTGHPETRFMFDNVACETISQEALFRMAGLPMVENCLSGYNSCIFAYGQTGSGKTYTMLGDIDDLEYNPSPSRGMAPRIFEFLFARIQAEEESRKSDRLKYSCKCSFIEIYNEQITDLLNPASTNLLLREDAKGVYVENLSEYEVYDVGGIMKLLTLGSLNRKVAATNMNEQSSRSHCVFTCVIESRWEKDSTPNFRFARLNLVDLAGSERQKSSGADGDRLKEAVNINKSLSTLGHVIMILVDVANGKSRHVPYRDSKLTFLLQDSLGGNSKTMIFANVSPSIGCAAETLNTLKFAQRAKLIKNNAVVNEDSTEDLNSLKHQIRALKEEITRLKFQHTSKTPFVISHEAARTEEEGGVSINKGDNEDASLDMVDGQLNGLNKQLNALEKTLAGALRREAIAEESVKRLQIEIEQLNRLVRQREEDTRSTKMMLRFREDKIQRMESVVNGVVDTDSYLIQENRSLSAENQLLRTKVEKNPEITRFALENIRLMDQVRRFQEFYEEGERERLISDLVNIREQLLFINEKSLHYNIENETVLHENNNEAEEYKRKMNSCLEENEKLNKKILEMQEAQVNSQFESSSQHKNKDLSCASSSELFVSNIPDDRNSEAILNLQLEIDILKIIIKERSLLAETAEKSSCLTGDLNLAYSKLVESQKECKDAIEELNNTKELVTALESEQLLAIEELEELKKSNNAYANCLKTKEHEVQMLKGQISLLERNDQRSIKKHHENSAILLNMKKMQASLDKARMLNMCYKQDNAKKESTADEMDEVRRQAEAETAEVIVSLQDELCLLQQQICEISLQEIETKQALQCMETKFEDLQIKFNKLNDDYEALQVQLEQKHMEIQLSSEHWEFLAREISDILLAAEDSITDATDELIDIRSSVPQRTSWTIEKMGVVNKLVFQKDCLILELKKCLEDATCRTVDLESKLQSLKEAAMAMNEMHQEYYKQKEKEVEMLRTELCKNNSKGSEEIIGLLCDPFNDFQNAMFDFEEQVLAKIEEFDRKLNSVEQGFLESHSNWCQGKKLLKMKSDEAEVVACQKAAEASSIYAKLDEVQLVLNALNTAYEKEKLDGDSSNLMVKNLAKEREILDARVQSLQFSNEQKDRYIDDLERQNISDITEMKKLVEEVEILTSQLFVSNEEDYKSMKDDIQNIAAISDNRARLVKSWIEGVWSEIVVKDCSMSVFHLCYLGILLEAVTGINAENCLLRNGLCQSNTIISDLRSYNSRTTNELQMFRTLKGKLLADLKSGFDRISRGEEQANRLHDVLTNFDGKINDLQHQEEAMLQKASQMSSQLALLMEDLNMSNSICVDSLVASRNMLKDKEELSNRDYEVLLESMLSKDVELCALKHYIQEMSSKKTETDVYLRSIIGQLQMALSVAVFNEELKSSELKLLVSSTLTKEKEVHEAKQASEILVCKLNDSRSEALELEQKILSLGNDVRDSVVRNEMLKDELEQSTEAKLAKEKRIETLESEIENLRNEIKVSSDICESFALAKNCMQREIVSSRSSAEHLMQELIVARVDRDLNQKLLATEESKVMFLAEAVDSAQNECINLLSLHSQSGARIVEAEKLNLTMSCRINELEIEIGKLHLDSLTKESASFLSSSTILHAESKRNHYETDIYLLESSLERFLTVEESGDTEVIRVDCFEQQTRAIESGIISLKGGLDLIFDDFLVKGYKNENSELQGTIIALDVMLTILRSQWDAKQADVSNAFSDLCMKNNEIDALNKRLKVLEDDEFLLKHTCQEAKNNQNNVLTRIESNLGSCLDTCARACADSEKLIEELINKRDSMIERLLNGISDYDERSHLFSKEVDKLECDLLNMLDDITYLIAELSRKDEILNGVLFDMSLLQELASNLKEEKDKLEKFKDLSEALKHELQIKSGELDKCGAQNQMLEALVKEKRDALANRDASYHHAQGSIAILSSENSELITKNRSLQEQVAEKTTLIENLETSLLRRSEDLDAALETMESMRNELCELNDEKDRLHLEVSCLNEQLEKANALADTNEAIAFEAKQMAETKSIYAGEKEAEVKLLESSIEELECTIDVLENKVGILKGEAEKQRFQREELEIELVTVKHNMQSLQTSDTEINRLLEKKELALKSLERDIVEKDKEISECKSYIAEINLHAEAQACEYKQKFKELKAMAENVKQEENSSSNKFEKPSSRPRGSGSPFKCIGLSHQVKSEKHEELTAAKMQIEELESHLVSKQKEIFALNARLAAAESMTHDVIRDLLGVKLDITNYASLMDNQQSKNQGEKSIDSAKEQEIIKLKRQLNEFIDERREWLEEIDKKQTEIVELENIREQNQLFKAENDSLKMENEKYKKCVIELQGKGKNTGQQNFFHQIHHHAKIKEENNSLKVQNENLQEKLRRFENFVHGNVPRFDDEKSLLNKLKETEDSKMQLAQQLLAICTSILEVAGIMRLSHEITPQVAEEALQQVKQNITSLEKEVQDLTCKNRIINERIRLFELQCLISSAASRQPCDGYSPSGQKSYVPEFDR